MKVPYAKTVYGREEIDAVLEVLKDPTRIVAGYKVREFEDKVAEFVGKRHVVAVNSGSSANLLAVEILHTARKEIITPILTFATTLTPIIQKGFKPVFVDVVADTYQIDLDKLEQAITPQTGALMIPSLIGNVSDMERLQKITNEHGLVLIEDSCDTLGTKWNGNPTGTYSDITTSGFYASHIITMLGGGGIIAVNDKAQSDKLRVMSNWGRQSTLHGYYEQSEDVTKRFEGEYDTKFLFTELGYNFQVTEAQGAFGVEQLRKYRIFADIRKNNFRALQLKFAELEDYFTLPKQHELADTPWLAFPLTIKKGIQRNKLCKYLENQGIQTRPIFSGDIRKHPAFSFLMDDKKFPIADHIMKNGLLVGCHQSMGEEEINYIFENVKKFIEENK